MHSNVGEIDEQLHEEAHGTSLIIGIPAAKIVSQYTCMMLHDEIPMPAFAFFPLISLDSIVINVVVFTCASWEYNKSVRSMKQLERNTLANTRKSFLKRA